MNERKKQQKEISTEQIKTDRERSIKAKENVAVLRRLLGHIGSYCAHSRASFYIAAHAHAHTPKPNMPHNRKQPNTKTKPSA